MEVAPPPDSAEQPVMGWGPSEFSDGHGEPLTPLPEGYGHTVQVLIKLLEARDSFTGGSCQRVAFYAATLAGELGMPRENVERLRIAGALHDVGKVGIRDAILLKPERLTPEEFAVMRHVPELSRDIILEAGMPDVALWVNNMHERPDGRGYPTGLIGDGIPLESRILHLADAMDAMTTPRIYRPEMSLTDALAELETNAGTQFDAKVAMLMLDLVRSCRIQVGEQPTFGLASAQAVDIAELEPEPEPEPDPAFAPEPEYAAEAPPFEGDFAAPASAPPPFASAPPPGLRA